MPGSEQTYNLSQETAELDVFVSHSWRSKWYLKHVSLLRYFNGRAAILSAHFIGALVGLLQLFGVLPTIRCYGFEADGTMHEFGLLTVFFAAVTYFLILVFGHHVFPSRQNLMFVAKGHKSRL